MGERHPALKLGLALFDDLVVVTTIHIDSLTCWQLVQFRFNLVAHHSDQNRYQLTKAVKAIQAMDICQSAYWLAQSFDFTWHSAFSY